MVAIFFFNHAGWADSDGVENSGQKCLHLLGDGYATVLDGDALGDEKKSVHASSGSA